MRCQCCGTDGRDSDLRGKVRVRSDNEGLCLICSYWAAKFYFKALFSR